MRGGYREGAGRKRSGFRKDTPHRPRPELDARHPVHVSLRFRVRIDHRNREIYAIARKVLQRYLGRDDFRIVHISLQNTHLHLLVEAANRRALTWGMQSFGITFAKAYHRKRGGCDKVFVHRYFANQITTERYARHALSYVLNNWRRHREDYANGTESKWKIDWFSSAISFTGWTQRFSLPKDYTPLPVSPPRTALLSSRWQHYGLVSPYECPGPLR